MSCDVSLILQSDLLGLISGIDRRSDALIKVEVELLGVYTLSGVTLPFNGRFVLVYFLNVRMSHLQLCKFRPGLMKIDRIHLTSRGLASSVIDQDVSPHILASPSLCLRNLLNLAMK